MTDNKNPAQGLGDLEVARDSLYREETFTDLQVATLRRLTPVKPDGSTDESRPTLFIGQTQIMTGRGPLPVQTEIEAATLAEALDKFPAAVQEAVHRMIEEAREYQRQAASRIVTPDELGGGLGGLGGPAMGGGPNLILK